MFGCLIKSPPVLRWTATVAFTRNGAPYDTFATVVEASTKYVAELLAVIEAKQNCEHFNTAVDFSVTVEVVAQRYSLTKL